MLTHTIHRPTESELMTAARRALDKRLADGPLIRHHAVQARMPDPAVTPERHERRLRHLRACHLPSLYEEPRHAPPKDNGAYVPSASARIDNDLNLTDGARRCGRKILEETYRRDRENRTLHVTVSYLAKGLDRSTRTVQRYLRVLERGGYLQIEVLAGHRSRLCIGLIIHLLSPLFPKHHRDKWPEKRGKPATTKESQNKRDKYLYSYNLRFRALHDPRCHAYPRQGWTEKCREGVFRALIRTIRALNPDPFGMRGAPVSPVCAS